MDTVQLLPSPFDAIFVKHLWVELLICVTLWLFVFCAIFLDLWDGVRTAVQTKATVHSHKLRVTIEKMSEYWRFMLIAFIVDAVIFIVCALLNYRPLPAVSFVFCIGLIGVEVKSMFEHAKRRKSRVLEMNDVLALIVNAATEKDAKKALKDVTDYLNKNERDGKD